MGRGTHRGFVTFDELNKSLGKRNLSDENLEQAFMHILDENVALVEKKSDFKTLKKKENSSKEEGKTIEKIFKFASIKHILNNYQNDQNKMFELLGEVSRDLKNYDLEFRIEELESKFSKDLSEITFNEIRELKKDKNIN